MSLSELVIGLSVSLCTIVDGISITGTLGDGDMSTFICGGGVFSVIDTLGYVFAFTFASVRIKIWGC